MNLGRRLRKRERERERERERGRERESEKESDSDVRGLKQGAAPIGVVTSTENLVGRHAEPEEKCHLDALVDALLDAH